MKKKRLIHTTYLFKYPEEHTNLSIKNDNINIHEIHPFTLVLRVDKLIVMEK